MSVTALGQTPGRIGRQRPGNVSLTRAVPALTPLNRDSRANSMAYRIWNAQLRAQLIDVRSSAAAS
jgi:hypothetical protein